MQSPLAKDRFGRLTQYPGKTCLPSPAQTPKTAVLLAFGQSNSANYGTGRYKAADNRVVNFFEGACYAAESPLLGADGEGGEPWTLLGNHLTGSGVFDQVIIVPAGVGATEIRRWAPEGDLHPMLMEVVRGVQKHYRITHLLWHQGELDFVLKTPEADYARAFQALLQSLREEGVAAPIYVCRATFVPDAGWTADNPVAAAQAKLVDGKTVFAGPDTDRHVPAADRHDQLHFAASGLETFARLWAEILSR
ncbi:MAG TPA: sialate O-acetylesterase [Alphaproteobacteria bacterium]|nr:sialate O-acetylesterase [Alphaproteobacteria bacterium]